MLTESFMVCVQELGTRCIDILDYSKSVNSDLEHVDADHHSKENDVPLEDNWDEYLQKMNELNDLEVKSDVEQHDGSISEKQSPCMDDKQNEDKVLSGDESSMSCPPGFKQFKNHKQLTPKHSSSSKTSKCSTSFARYRKKDIRGISLIHEISRMIEVGETLGYDVRGCKQSLHKIINGIGVQETKMTKLELFCLKSMWGNYTFDYACSLARGRSGGLVFIWDPMFTGLKRIHVKHLCGLCSLISCIIIEENILRLAIGMKFVKKLIGLVDLPLGGLSFTWMNKAGTKMSKLDRFLISLNVFDSLPDLKVLTLDKISMKQTESNRRHVVQNKLKELEEKVDACRATDEDRDTRIRLLREWDDLERVKAMDLAVENVVENESHFSLEVFDQDLSPLVNGEEEFWFISGVGEGKVESIGGIGGGSFAKRSMVAKDGLGGNGFVVDGGRSPSTSSRDGEDGRVKNKSSMGSRLIATGEIVVERLLEKLVELPMCSPMVERMVDREEKKFLD
ncbi:hypothetical protein Tco_1302345 [Tanacetum coccineum]